MCVLTPELQAILDAAKRDVRRMGVVAPHSPVGPDGIRLDTWELIDRCRMDLGMAPRVVAPPAGTYAEPDEETRAADKAGAKRCWMDDRICAMLKNKVERSRFCGRGAAIQLARPRKGAAGFDLHTARFCCGRSECPHCFRKRIIKTYKRSARVLLDREPYNPMSRKPRVGDLHCRILPWGEGGKRYNALDKSIRRAHGNIGRLHIRMVGGDVCVIAEKPFRGSEPLSPDDALGKAVECIDMLDPARNSFRLQGTWKDKRKTEWKKIDEFSPKLDFREAKKALEEAGAHVEMVRKGAGKTGIYFGAASADEAARLINVLRKLDGVSEYIQGEGFSSRTYSDKKPDDKPRWLFGAPHEPPPDEGEIPEWAP
jgi:hypothetical protein